MTSRYQILDKTYYRYYILLEIDFSSHLISQAVPLWCDNLLRNPFSQNKSTIAYMYLFISFFVNINKVYLPTNQFSTSFTISITQGNKGTTYSSFSYFMNSTFNCFRIVLIYTRRIVD